MEGPGLRTVAGFRITTRVSSAIAEQNVHAKLEKASNPTSAMLLQSSAKMPFALYIDSLPAVAPYGHESVTRLDMIDASNDI
jgi:hypothetical protein